VGLYGFIKQHFNQPYINWKGFGVRQFIAALNFAHLAALEKAAINRRSPKKLSCDLPCFSPGN
jgi:hypothetical protein